MSDKTVNEKPKRNLGRGGILWVAVAIALGMASWFSWVVFIEPRLG